MKKLLFSLIALLGCLPLYAQAATPATITLVGPSTVRPGQVFAVTAHAKDLVNIDTIRLNGTFTSGVLVWDHSQALTQFQNISPGTYVDQPKGVFSFGAYSLSSVFNEGDLVTMFFRADHAGSAVISLDKTCRIYANGIEKPVTADSLMVTVAGPPLPTTTLPTATKGALTVTSPSHPDPNLWYTSPDVTLNWEVSTQAKAVFTGFDQSPQGPANQRASGSSIALIATQDGVWYAHVLAEYADGTSDRIDFTVRIDGTAPLAIQPVMAQDTASPSQGDVIHFATLDQASGIDYYRVSVDGQEIAKTRDNFLSLTSTIVGEHVVTIEAYDLAGNMSTGQVSYQVAKQISPTYPQVNTPFSPVVLGLSYVWYVNGYWLLLLLVLLVIVCLLWRRHRRERRLQIKQTVSAKTKTRKRG